MTEAVAVSPSEATSTPGPVPITFVLIAATAAMAATGVCAWFHLGWLSAWVVTLGTGAVFAGYAAVTRNVVLGKLLACGVIVGVAEVLGADRWAVQMGTLVYAPHGPFIVDSPGYMPVSWMVATTQFSVIGLWLADRFGLAKATVLTAIVGGLNLPLYEHLAKGADWWFYQHVPMIWSTPWYVILGEILIGALFPICGRAIVTKPLVWSIPIGIGLGVWMLVAGWLAYQVAG